MGTRGSFWIGDPRDLTKRKWLGCIAFDAHPGNWRELRGASSVREFRNAIKVISRIHYDNFTDPFRHGWPFPWADDIFCTDYTYAFFKGQTWLSCFRTGLVPARDLRKLRSYFQKEDDDPTLTKVAAPSRWDRSAPDSIIVVSASR